jgi:hypothetical protein
MDIFKRFDVNENEFICVHYVDKPARHFIYYNDNGPVIIADVRINNLKQAHIEITKMPIHSEANFKIFHEFMKRLFSLLNCNSLNDVDDFVFTSKNYELKENVFVYDYLLSQIPDTPRKNLINYFDKIFWKYGNNTQTVDPPLINLPSSYTSEDGNINIDLVPFQPSIYHNLSVLIHLYRANIENLLKIKYINAKPEDAERLKNINPCQVYGECSFSYILILYNPKTRDYLGHAVVIVFDEFIELYDVIAVDKGKGYGKFIMDFIVKETKKEFIWLGVMVNNPDYKQAISLYSKYNFCYPHIGNTTQGQLTIDGSQFVSLLHIKNCDFCFNKKDYILNYFDNIKCFKRYTIQPKILKKLYELLDDSHENGGHFQVASVTIDDIDIDMVTSKPEEFNIEKIISSFKGSIIRGQIQSFSPNQPRYHTVTVPPSEIMFHTHPTSCYKDFNCYIGWPSGGDFQVIITYYNKSRMHLVVTCEGIYIINVTTFLKEFIDDLKKNPMYYDIHNIIIKMIFYTFTKIENRRFYNIDASIIELELKSYLDDSEKQELKLFKDIKSLISTKQPFNHFLDLRINWFLQFVNNYSLHQLIDDNITNNSVFIHLQPLLESIIKTKPYVKNLKLFNISFEPWSNFGLPAKYQSRCEGDLCSYEMFNNVPIGFKKIKINPSNLKSMQVKPLVISVNTCLEYTDPPIPILSMNVLRSVSPTTLRPSKQKNPIMSTINPIMSTIKRKNNRGNRVNLRIIKKR